MLPDVQNGLLPLLLNGFNVLYTAVFVFVLGIAGLGPLPRFGFQRIVIVRIDCPRCKSTSPRSNCCRHTWLLRVRAESPAQQHCDREEKRGLLHHPFPARLRADPSLSQASASKTILGGCGQGVSITLCRVLMGLQHHFC